MDIFKAKQYFVYTLIVTQEKFMFMEIIKTLTCTGDYNNSLSNRFELVLIGPKMYI